MINYLNHNVLKINFLPKKIIASFLICLVFSYIICLNLKSIIKSSRDYIFPIKIELIISNNIKAKGLKIAKKYSIPYKYFSSKSKKIFERKCLFEVSTIGRHSAMLNGVIF